MEDSTILFSCGPEPKPTGHVCDIKGKWVVVDSAFGEVDSASCSICGRPAFDIWDVMAGD